MATPNRDPLRPTRRRGDRLGPRTKRDQLLSEIAGCSRLLRELPKHANAQGSQWVENMRRYYKRHLAELKAQLKAL